MLSGEELIAESDASRLFPIGRIAYRAARQCIVGAINWQETETIKDAEKEKQAPSWKKKAATAIQLLDTGHSEGILEPPLTKELAGAVQALAESVDLHGRPKENFNPYITSLVLDAVYEHGYRSA
jgi:hypothetical protein